MNQRGFNLIELIMVVVLVGIISTYAASRFDNSAFTNKKIAHEIMEAIRYAQAMAMSHSGADSDGDGNFDRYRINFNSAANTYEIVIDDIDSANLGNVANPVSGSASYTQSWSSGVNITASVSSISFNSRGEPVGLASDASIDINGNLTLIVETLTGYVSL